MSESCVSGGDDSDLSGDRLEVGLDDGVGGGELGCLLLGCGL